jgi:hypothetical protein
MRGKLQNLAAIRDAIGRWSTPISSTQEDIKVF